MEKTKKKISVFNKILIITVCALLAVYSLSMIYILFWGILTSLKADIDFGSPIYNTLGFPNMQYSEEEFLRLKNYALVIENFNFSDFIVYTSGQTEIRHEYNDIGLGGLLLNTFIYAGVGSFIATLVPAIVGYMCAKYRGRFSSIVYVVNLFVMATPLVGTSVSTITFMRSIRLYDTWIGNFIQKFSFTGMYFLVFYAFFAGVSDSYSEAAEVDGASQLRIMVSIILPLALKTISSVMLINFITYWNDYQTLLLYLPTKPTLSYAVYRSVVDGDNRKLTFTPARVAACMLLALPILIIFIAFRNKLMGSVSMGGVKE